MTSVSLSKMLVMLPGGRQRHGSAPLSLKSNYERQEQGEGMEAGLEAARLHTPRYRQHNTPARLCVAGQGRASQCL